MFARNALLLLFAVLIAGTCGRKLPLRGVTLEVDRAANEQSPVPTEVVFVFERSLVEKVGALAAEEWFRQRDQIRNDYPSGYRSLYWELVPGQTLRIDPIPRTHSGAHAVFLFARYTTEGAHRLRLDPVRIADVHLGESGPVLRNAVD